MTIKYCQKCLVETERYKCGKCKPCGSKQDAKYYAERRALELAGNGGVPLTREPTNREGTLHGQIHGGQGCVRPHPRRGSSMGF